MIQDLSYLVFVLYGKSLIILNVLLLSCNLIDKFSKYFKTPDYLKLFLSIKRMVDNNRYLPYFLQKLHFVCCGNFIKKKHSENI
jgi:hypothetical protein